jgi:hypothetical protein
VTAGHQGRIFVYPPIPQLAGLLIDGVAGAKKWAGEPGFQFLDGQRKRRNLSRYSWNSFSDLHNQSP